MALSQTGAPQVNQDPAEAPLLTQVMRSFRGVNTRAQRSAIPDDTFYDLQNLIPIGDANLHCVNGLSASLHDFSTDTIYAMQYGMVASVPYLFCYSTQGNIIAWNLNASTATKINGANTLSAGGCKSVPWYNTYQLFIDSTGYYSWDGVTFSQLALAQGPASGTDISVYAGRVWVCSGRLTLYSGPYDGTGTMDPTANTAWQVAVGAGFLTLTDPTLVGNINRLWQQNGFLYFFGPTCVYALSDIYVPAGASPPTPVFVLTPVQSIIGTDQAFSVFPFNRALMFASKFGVWAIEGVNATKISEDLDGTWQYLDFTQSISGGQCIVSNILNACFLVKRANDPILGSNTVIAMFFSGRWWFANVGAATFIAAAVVNNTPALYCLIGNHLYQAFASTTNPPDTQIMTPLWGGDDALSDKQVIRAGFEIVVSSPTSGASVTATLDTYNGSSPLPLQTNPTFVKWINNSGAVVTWQNNTPATVNWFVNLYQIYNALAPAMFAKHVGMTVKTSGFSYELDSFYMDMKRRTRWTHQ